MAYDQSGRYFAEAHFKGKDGKAAREKFEAREAEAKADKPNK